jgi:Glycosyl transferase family 2
MPSELSVILVNKYGFLRLQRILESLAAQSLASQLEVIVVSPFEAPGGGSEWPFARIRYVKCGRVDSLGPARAAGAQACSTPYLVFGEDHCFPHAGWAEALLARLRQDWTGVGPVIQNHNPATWISQADWLLNYAGFAYSAGGPTNYIPPHNSAYDTAALKALGPDLAELLQMDHHLQERLLSNGGRLFLEPLAQAAHTNLSRPLAHWASQFHGSRVYGATRALHMGWPLHRRVVYAAAFPAIAALRLARACMLFSNWRAFAVLPLLAVAATLAGLGEASGYVFGLGSALLSRADEELDRPSGIVASEQHLLLPSQNARSTG